MNQALQNPATLTKGVFMPFSKLESISKRQCQSKCQCRNWFRPKQPKQKRFYHTFFFFFAFLFVGFLTSPGTSYAREVRCVDILIVIPNVFGSHFSFESPFSGNFLGQLWERYLESHPYMKDILLESDVQWIQKEALPQFFSPIQINLSFKEEEAFLGFKSSLGDKLDYLWEIITSHPQRLQKVKTHCDLLVEINDLYVQRLEEWIHFLESKWNPNLKGTSSEETPFEVDPHLEIVLNPQEPFKNKTDWASFHEGLLQYRIALARQNKEKSPGEFQKDFLQGAQKQLVLFQNKNKEEIYTDFLKRFLSAFDNHTRFLSEDEMKSMMNNMQGKMLFSGIGISLFSGYDENVSRYYIEVKSVLPGGPTYRSNALEAGDRIIGIGEEESQIAPLGDDTSKNFLRIRGPKETRVHLKVIKKDGQEKTVSIVRGPIFPPKERLFYAQRSGKKVALLKIPSFVENTGKEVERFLNMATQEKADAVLVDVSFDTGGSLRSVLEALGNFIAGGSLLQSYSPKLSSNPAFQIRDTDNKIAFSGPVAVLVNGMSASASEIMAGTLKAYSRALIIGSEKTYGKGSVQTVTAYPFGALKVTGALYLLPNGDAPHNQGVTSHITIPSYESVLGRNDKKYALSPPENGTVTLSPCEEVGESHPYERVKVGDPQKWQSLRALTASDMETLRFFSRQRLAQNADLQQRAFVQPG